MNVRSEDLLILFIKNMIRGRVKSRLSADLGADLAMAIYGRLLKETLKACEGVNADIWLLFSDHTDNHIGLKERDFSRGVQKGTGLGDKMLNAFVDGFNAGYRHICLAGTDCYGITTDILQDAFNVLGKNDFVLGPANDGGYYLIGMNFPCEKVFSGKVWSTSGVLEDTLRDISEAGYSAEFITQLVDIDTKDDLDQLDLDPKIFLSHDT